MTPKMLLFCNILGVERRQPRGKVSPLHHSSTPPGGLASRPAAQFQATVTGTMPE